MITAIRQGDRLPAGDWEMTEEKTEDGRYDRKTCGSPAYGMELMEYSV